MKRLMTALFSATLIATFFAGTPAPTFAAATEDYYIGYDDGPGGTGCGSPDFEVYNGNNDNSLDRLEDNLQAALNVVDDGDTIIICSGWYSLHGDMAQWDGNQGGIGDPVDPISITIRGSGDASDTVIDGYRADYYWDGDSDEYTDDRYNAFNFENTNLTVTDLTFTKTAADNVASSGSAIAVSGGSLVVENVNFNWYDTATDGGAIAAWDAEVSISDSNFDQTTGLYSVVNEDGGAVWIGHNDSAPKTVSITGTSFNGNSSNGNGGAVWAYCADMTVADSEFYDNSTGAKGGAIWAKSDSSCTGELTISESVFEGNRIDGDFGEGIATWRHMGGAVYSVGQDMTVTDSNFGADGGGNGNRATNGGAIAMFDNTTGTATLTVSGTDFTDNYSPSNGGALWLACVNATITGDGEGTFDSFLEGASSTFWGNGAEDGGAIYAYANGSNNCDDDEASLEIDGVDFESNYAHDGGAVATRQGAPDVDVVSIANSNFVNNHADRQGGALNIDEAETTIDASGFWYNESSSHGGAAELSGPDADLSITDTAFVGNISYQQSGGALAVRNMYSMTISGSSFESNSLNSSNEVGGAIYRVDGQAADIIESTDFVDNTTGFGGDGAAIWTDNTVGITNSSFRDNSTGTDGYGGAIRQQDGTLTVTGSDFDNNLSFYHGGAIYTEGNGLYIAGSTFTNNETRWDNGGAIYVDSDTNGRDCPQDWCTAITNSSFEGNIAETGGAIYSSGESLSVQRSSFIDNTSDDEGGAIRQSNEELLIKDSVFRSNRALFEEGGAVAMFGDLPRHSLKVQASTFTDNSTGGDYYMGRYKSGGAIFTDANEAGDVVMSIAGSTFTGNYASANGGAVYSGGPLTVSGSLFSRNRADGLKGGDGGAIYANEFANIETNVMRNNSADQGYGGAVFFDGATQASVFSRNLLDANTAYNGGGVAIFGYAEGSNRMAIHTNRIWNNVASNNGGGLWVNFTEAGALYELASNMKSTMFVRNRAIYGAAGLVEVSSVTKANQRIFTSLTKSNKYQLNRSTMRGWDKLMLKLETLN